MKLLTALPLLGALALISIGQTARAEHFDVNTTAIVGQSGFLNFQFNPMTDGTTPFNSSVTIYNFSGGTLGDVDSSTHVTGTLPGGVTITNDGPTNELVQVFTFGDKLSFDTSFPSINMDRASLEPFAVPDEGNLFQFFVLDSGQNPFETTDPSGYNSLVLISQGANGLLAPSETYRLTSPASVPEPSSGLSLLVLSALVLIPVALAGRRQRKIA